MSNRDEEMYRVEAVVGGLLRIGVLISAFIIVVGLILFIFTGKSGYPENFYPTTIHDICSGLLALKPFAIIMFGLFCLILTPVLRVVVSFVTFFIEKDYLYVIITAIVLLILVISFFMGTK
ncbi:DUF1634 domain-containing protein [Listeria sp. PSOL-1]|uniref:DUF1634 domain-containing protein n=1 Tax=Listeria sp. PSOL-1 TaxID=1844999 RepID=UPI0013D1CE2B|nr:DUF1634 domain-containing protein [Listeria sp. PSOL-1]